MIHKFSIKNNNIYLFNKNVFYNLSVNKIQSGYTSFVINIILVLFCHLDYYDIYLFVFHGAWN